MKIIENPSQCSFRCLHLELRSGGNVRFERTEEPQIQELLTSRFRRSRLTVFLSNEI